MKNNIQTISRKDLYTIYKSDICVEWKSRIVEVLAEQSGENLNISELDIKKSYSEANSTQKKLLEKYFDIVSASSIMKEINTFDDVLQALGKKMEDILPWKKPKNKNQLSQNAFAKIQCITELYNDGEKFDWTNSNQYKYYPWFQKNARGGWVLSFVYYYSSLANVGFGYYFKSKELAEDAVKKFMDIYKDYLPE